MSFDRSSGDVEMQDLLSAHGEASDGVVLPATIGAAGQSKQERSTFRTAAFVFAGLACAALFVTLARRLSVDSQESSSVAAGRSLILTERDPSLVSGDVVFLRAHTGRLLEVTPDGLEARSSDFDGAEAFVLVRASGGGKVAAGDAVYLRAQNNAYVTVSGASVASAFVVTPGEHERLVVEKRGNGTIGFGDEVYLKAYTGEHLSVGEKVIRAELSEKGAFEAFVILQKGTLDQCSKTGENCAESECCRESGHQCYQKDDYWSQCMETCTPGPNPADQSSPMPWSCKALGWRMAGPPKQCSAAGESCAHTKCCEAPGTTCFEKDGNWAMCKPFCTPGLDMTDEVATPWSCKALGPQSPTAAPWVATTCAGPGADCSKSMCCSTPGHQCYLKSEFWGQCRDTCTPGEKLAAWDQPWNCSTLGSRTPGATDDVRPPVQPWAVDRCSMADADCTKSHCCLAVGQTCFGKDASYAMCRDSCNSTRGAIEENQTWGCEAIGAPSEGLALKGFPSLYCVSVMRVEGYEPGLMTEQMKIGGGIFACDGYDIVADGVITLGTSKDGRVVKTLDIPKVEVGVSQDGTAANTKLFMKFWDRIIATHKFNYYDWTAKVDPDAVLMPWRLRKHMEPHVGTNVYVVNCNKFPNSPNFPMMYGALEVFSLKAMQIYAAGSGKCGSDFWPAWEQWGEDYFMTHCMDHLGVGRIGDFGILGDNMCTGANCGDGFVSTFHPFKTVASWMECWAQANPAVEKSEGKSDAEAAAEVTF